jgi:fumarate hydratase class II
MVCAQVIGNDVLHCWWNARHRIECFQTSNGKTSPARLLVDACMSLTNIAQGIEPNYKRIKELVDNLMLVTALNTKMDITNRQKLLKLLTKRNNFKRGRSFRYVTRRF